MEVRQAFEQPEALQGQASPWMQREEDREPEAAERGEHRRKGLAVRREGRPVGGRQHERRRVRRRRREAEVPRQHIARDISGHHHRAGGSFRPQPARGARRWRAQQMGENVYHAAICFLGQIRLGGAQPRLHVHERHALLVRRKRAA